MRNCEQIHVFKRLRIASGQSSAQTPPPLCNSGSHVTCHVHHDRELKPSAMQRKPAVRRGRFLAAIVRSHRRWAIGDSNCLLMPAAGCTCRRASVCRGILCSRCQARGMCSNAVHSRAKTKIRFTCLQQLTECWHLYVTRAQHSMP